MNLYAVKREHLTEAERCSLRCIASTVSYCAKGKSPLHQAISNGLKLAARNIIFAHNLYPPKKA